MNAKKHGNKKRISFISIFSICLLGLILFSVAVVLLLLPAFISSERGNRIILERINTAVDGTAHFEDLSMGWRSGIRILNLSFETANGDLSVKADEFSTIPSYMPLLRGHISVGKTMLIKPQISVALDEQPEEDRVEAARDIPQKSDGIPQIPIQKVDIHIAEGVVVVSQAGNLLTKAENINIDIQIKPGGKKSLLNFSVDIPAGTTKPSTVQASGFIIPEGSGIRRDFQKATGEFSVKLNSINLSSVEPFLKAAGLKAVLSGTLDGNIKTAILNGMIDNINGGFESSDLKFGGDLLNDDIFASKNLSIDTDIFMDNNLIKIASLDIKGDYFSASAEGSLPATLDSLDEFLKSAETRLSADLRCNVATLAGQLKNSIGLDDNMKIISGQLTSQITKLDGTDKSPLNATASLSGLSGIVDQKQVSLIKPVEITARIAPEDDGILFEKVGLKSDFADIAGSGTDKLFNYKAQVDLLKMHNQIGSFLYSPEYSLSGRLNAQGKAIIKDMILLEGRNTIDNLRVTVKKRVAESAAFQTSHKLSINTSDQTAAIDEMEIDANFGNISVKDAFIPFANPEDGSLNLPVSIKLDFARLEPWVALFVEFPEDMKVEAHLNSDINISSQKGSFLINTENTAIKNLKLVLSDSKPVIDNLINIKLNAKSDAEFTNYQAKWDIQSIAVNTEGEFKNSSAGNNESIEGNLRLEYDWKKLSKFAEPFLPDGLVITGKRNDSYQFSSSYSTDIEGSMLANLSASGKIGFDSAQYMGLNAGKTEVNAKAINGKLNIPIFETQVNNGKLRFGCMADFNADPVMLQLPEPMDIISEVEINDVVASQLLQYVNPVFANVAGVSGQADLSCRKMTVPIDMDYFEEAELDATLSIENMTIQSSGLLKTILTAASVKTERQIMHIRPTNFILEKGYISYDDMQLEVEKTPINFKGRIGVQDESLNMDVLLPYTRDGSTVKVEDEIAKENRISVPLKGTLGKPKIDVAGALKKEILEEGIKRGLDRLFK